MDLAWTWIHESGSFWIQVFHGFPTGGLAGTCRYAWTHGMLYDLYMTSINRGLHRFRYAEATCGKPMKKPTGKFTCCDILLEKNQTKRNI